MSIRLMILSLAAGAALVAQAIATPFTMTSPAGGALPGGVTQVGGVVLDLMGTNGARVVSQLPASSLYSGYFNTGTPVGYRGNPGTIGIQAGFAPAVTGALGGGIASLAVRITLYDGDTYSGDFDFNDNSLRINGVLLGAAGNFSGVTTRETNTLGTAEFSGDVFGFRNNRLHTGFFSVTDAPTLLAIYNDIVATQHVVFSLHDVDPYDNIFDFTAGVDGGLIDVGQPPVVEPPPPPAAVPEPVSLAVWLTLGIIGLCWHRRKH